MAVLFKINDYFLLCTFIISVDVVQASIMLNCKCLISEFHYEVKILKPLFRTLASTINFLPWRKYALNCKYMFKSRLTLYPIL